MRAMKDSGIAWIGEIPEEWQIHRIKVNFQIITGNGFSPQLQGIIGEQYPMYKASDISYSGKYIYTAANSVSERVAKEQHFNIIPSGSILFAKVGEAMKKNNRAINATPCCIDNNCQAMVPHNINTDYGYYIFSIIDLNEFDNGGTVPCINNQKLRSYFIPYPSVNEQQHIADYLDRKCSQIDAIIARQQEVIEKLKAYKLSVITEAVTKGLNPHAPMKDSGVEWIGEIPEHWGIRKLKSIVDIISKGTTPSTIGSELRSCGEIRFLKAENIQNNRVVLEPEFYIDKETHSILKRSQLKENDILFVIAGATIGKTAILSGDAIPANTNQAVSFIRLKEKDDSKYVWYYLQSCYVKTILNQLSVQSAQPNLSMEDMGDFYLCYPSKKERNLIAEKLDNCCAEIDGIIYNKENLVLKLTGYKKSLIYEVITGKKEV